MEEGLSSKVQEFYDLPKSKEEIKLEKLYSRIMKTANELNLTAQVMEIYSKTVIEYKSKVKQDISWSSYQEGLLRHIVDKCSEFLEPYARRREEIKSFDRERNFREKQLRLF